MDDVLVDGGTIWSLGISMLEWSLDGCEGVLLVHVARIVRVNRKSCGSSFDLMCSPCVGGAGSRVRLLSFSSCLGGLCDYLLGFPRII